MSSKTNTMRYMSLADMSSEERAEFYKQQREDNQKKIDRAYRIVKVGSTFVLATTFLVGLKVGMMIRDRHPKPHSHPEHI